MDKPISLCTECIGGGLVCGKHYAEMLEREERARKNAPVEEVYTDDVFNEMILALKDGMSFELLREECEAAIRLYENVKRGRRSSI